MPTLKNLLLFVVVLCASGFLPDGRFSRGQWCLSPNTVPRQHVACMATKDHHIVSDAPIDKEKLFEGMDRFVSVMRDMYSDLENRGGSIRRQMNGLGFTYISPVTLSPGENRQLFGAWRLQQPTIVDVEENMTEIHQSIVQERFKSEQSSNIPPLLIYLPGLDGFGISATAQFDDLSSSFEFWRMTVDKKGKKLSFNDLVSSVVKFVRESASITGSIESQREVIIVGESFGGLLACAVAMALTKIQSSAFVLKGVVLVNPATSFDKTSWERVVPMLTSYRHLESQEEAADGSNNLRLPTPYSVVGGISLAATVPGRSQFPGILQFFQQTVSRTAADKILSSAVDGFDILAEYLPPDLLDQRVMIWLPVGTAVVNNLQRLSKLTVPTLIIGGSEDNMLPTKIEADRLGKLLPDCVVMDIAGAGHFVLDAGFNLTEAIIDSHIDPLNSKKVYDPISDWTLPPEHIVKAVIEKQVFPLRERTSPVFFSTDPVSGKRRMGLSHVPSTASTNRPVLFVANHQLGGLDLGMIISQLLEERGIMARGLAHPIAMGDFVGVGGPRAGIEEPRVRKQKMRWEYNERNQFGGDLFSMFGAVTVSPRNFYRLLQTKQTALLFPGGVREVFHRKGEAYQIFWPKEKTDFVRVAAKFNATIVTLSAIGAADSVEMLLDADELLGLPFGIGDRLSNFSSSVIPARFDAQREDEIFIPPLAVPKPIAARHYFLFGKPFDTSSLDPKNLDACRDMYMAIEDEITHDIQALLEARKNDPYALDGVKRTSYQRLFGKDPPTFSLEFLQSAKT